MVEGPDLRSLGFAEYSGIAVGDSPTLTASRDGLGNQLGVGMPHEPMMCAFLIISFLATCYGYGLLLCRLCALGRSTDMGYTAAAGMAVLVFLGGILNAAGWAFGWVIDALIGLGLVPLVIRSAAVVRHREDRSKFASSLRMELLEPGLWVAVLALVFSAITIVPTTTFNPHDDLTQYLLRPLLMLQSGSLNGNWFDSTGADSMGAQSWLQAFLLNYLPITYADVFDDVICLPLCCLVVTYLGRLLGAPKLQRFLAALCVVFMDPVQVNTSAKYSLTLMMLGLTVSLLLFSERYFGGGIEAKPAFLRFVPVVLFGSAAVALKFTTVVVCVALALTIVVAAAIWFRKWRDVATLVLVSALTSVVMVGPWIAAFRTNYLAIFSAPDFPLADPKLGMNTGLLWDGFAQMISVDAIQFGQRGLISSGYMFLAAGTALHAVLRLTRGRAGCAPADAFTLLIICIAAVASYLVSAFLIPWGLLRYAEPIFMAVVPAAILYLFARLSLVVGLMPVHLVVVTGVFWGAILLANAYSLISRVGVAWTGNTALLFGREASFRAGIGDMFTATTMEKVRAAQSYIPPGKKMLASIAMPTDLDFGRNPGYAMFMASLVSPWFGDLGGMTPAEVRDYLMTFGIEYILWQDSGAWIIPAKRIEEVYTRSPYAMIRKTATNFLAIYHALNAGMGPTTFRNANFQVVRLDPSYSPTRTPLSYEIGQSIDFTTDGYNPYLLSGWAAPEPPGTWTISEVAQLRLELGRRPSSDLMLKARLTPYIFAQHPAISVAVEVNGGEVGVWRMTAMTPTTECVIIPGHFVANGAADIRLRIDAPVIPKAYGLSSDTRPLGVLVRSMILETVSDDKECSG
jgi:hypothetical protein